MSLPRVLVDLRALANPYSGLAHFSAQFARHLAGRASAEMDLWFLLPRGGSHPLEEGVRCVEDTLELRLRWSWSGRFDLWHSLFPAVGGPYGRARHILTIHDLMRERSAGAALRRLQRRVESAAAVVFISRHTEATARAQLRLPPALPVFTIPNGVDLPAGEPSRPSFLGRREFLLSLGELRPRKNFEALIEMLPFTPGLDLVVAGSRSPFPRYARALEQRARRLSLEDRVVIPGSVTEAEKVFLYQRCRAFALASTDEGFGIPVVEAMGFGKPVFLSRLASLPEVGGSQAFYWDSFDPEPMASVVREGLEAFDSDPSRPGAARDRARSYAWEGSLARYLEVYRAVLASG